MKGVHVVFNKLVQTGNVLKSIEKFEELKAVLLCKNSHLDESYFVSSFISGLKWGLKSMVRLTRPNTLDDAIEIAQFQEQTVDQIIKKNMTSLEEWVMEEIMSGCLVIKRMVHIKMMSKLGVTRRQLTLLVFQENFTRCVRVYEK